MKDLITFKECLGITEGENRHVLLGNGFSRACKNNIFSYNSLFDSADFIGASPEIKNAFKLLETTDFEFVMNSLKNSSILTLLYDPSNISLIDKLQNDTNKLREILVKTLTTYHPEDPSNISDLEYNNCLKFLSYFKKIYSLNYDLLLYWTFMKEPGLKRDDGFRDSYSGRPQDYVEEEFVVWENKTHNQNIHYLHGALHLFYSGPDLQKYCWERTGVKLIDQIDSSLRRNKYPLIVAEGSSRQKLEKIRRSDYLGHNFRSLGLITGNLFLYGHSLAENDRHILEQISENKKLKRIFISIYGDPNDPSKKEIIARGENLRYHRGEDTKKEIYFYKAETAKVWR
jgi:hypothetical protein